MTTKKPNRSDLEQLDRDADGWPLEPTCRRLEKHLDDPGLADKPFVKMFFRSLVDQDFHDLNRVLERLPGLHGVAIEQIKHGKRWNEDIAADPVEATKLLRRVGDINDTDFEQALCAKLVRIGNFEASELKQFLDATLAQKDHIDSMILAHYRREIQSWIDNSQIHLLQKKSIENLLKKL